MTFKQQTSSHVIQPYKLEMTSNGHLSYVKYSLPAGQSGN